MSLGFAGKILYVNLREKSYRTEPTEKYQEWIGGRSLGSFLLSKHPDLSRPEIARQPIAVSAGPLIGTGIPLGTRTAVTARNLISGGFCFSNVGGDYGTRMKMAGFDSIVIEEASDSPVYILLRSSGVEIVPASDLWGKLTSEFLQCMFDRYATEDLSYIGIGPGGEKQLNIACLMVDRGHAAGWGGSGAIFGAKNLKAVVAIGNTKIPVFDEQGLLRKNEELNYRIAGSEAMSLLVRGGTHGMAGAGGYAGTVPNAINNMNDEYMSLEKIAPIREHAFDPWVEQRSGCYECKIDCLHRYTMNTKKYGQVNFEGLHANSVRGLGTNWGVLDAEDLAKAHTLCNDYGLDVDGVSSSIAYAIEAAENGMLPDEYLRGMDLKWGNGEAAVKLVEEICENRGFGKILALGVYRAAQIVGNGTEVFAMTTKKIGMNEQGLRSHRAWALGIMASTRGSGHLGGSPQTENRQISPEAGNKVFKNPKAGKPDAYEGKGKLVAWTSGIKVIIDSLGLCYFAYSWYDVSLGNPYDLVEMLYLATGIKITTDELLQKGLRVHHLERYLSYLYGGFTRKDDSVPDRFYTTSVADGPFKGSHLDREPVNKMLNEYYQELGWNIETGLPEAELLKSKGLGYLLDIPKTK